MGVFAGESGFQIAQVLLNGREQVLQIMPGRFRLGPLGIPTEPFKSTSSFLRRVLAKNTDGAFQAVRVALHRFRHLVCEAAFDLRHQ